MSRTCTDAGRVNNVPRLKGVSKGQVDSSVPRVMTTRCASLGRSLVRFHASADQVKSLASRITAGA